MFADTGYGAALLNPRDNLHQIAMTASKSLGQVRLVTTEMVLAELLASLAKLPTRSLAIKGVDSIRQNPNVEVVPRHHCSSQGRTSVTALSPTRHGVSPTVPRST